MSLKINQLSLLLSQSALVVDCSCQKQVHCLTSVCFFCFFQDYTPLLVIYLCIIGEIILHNYPAFVHVVDSAAQQLNKQVMPKK